MADRALNHQSATISAVAAIYNRFSYLAELKEALEVWGCFVSLPALGGGKQLTGRTSGVWAKRTRIDQIAQLAG